MSNKINGFGSSGMQEPLPLQKKQKTPVDEGTRKTSKIGIQLTPSGVSNKENLIPINRTSIGQSTDANVSPSQDMIAAAKLGLVNEVQLRKGPQNPEQVTQLVMLLGQESLMNSKNPISKGRKALVQEMLRYPDQLRADISRQGKIVFHNTPLTRDKQSDLFKAMEDGETHRVYNNLSNQLFHYIKSMNPKLRITPNIINELLYGTVQNFLAQITGNERDLIKQGIVPDPKRKPEKQLTFKMEDPGWFGDSEVMTVSNKVTKPLISLDEAGDSNPTSRGKEVMEFEMKYNLKTGSVTFDYKFSVFDENGKKIQSAKDSFDTPQFPSRSAQA